MNQSLSSLFDAIRVVRFPNGGPEAPLYYSQTGRTTLKIGDVGVVIGNWPGNRLRVEGVSSSGAIDWQDHLTIDQVEMIPITDAPYCRRRINNTWAWYLSLNGTEIEPGDHADALRFARKVMKFARRNVELLVDRLKTTGYHFANPNPFISPAEGIADMFGPLAASGVHFPIALQAWFMEVGRVDLRGTHPDWPRSAYSGILDDRSPRRNEPWHTDPLVIDVDLSSFLDGGIADGEPMDAIEIAPDIVHKANISGGGPIALACSRPAFDNVLIRQSGSFTLLAYLKHAFDWAGFPGFDFIADAPLEHIRFLSKGMVRL